METSPRPVVYRFSVEPFLPVKRHAYLGLFLCSSVEGARSFRWNQAQDPHFLHLQAVHFWLAVNFIYIGKNIGYSIIMVWLNSTPLFTHKFFLVYYVWGKLIWGDGKKRTLAESSVLIVSLDKTPSAVTYELRTTQKI